ncbi:MAG TPA: Rieske (2Fe-2S) protein [Gemmatimonadaceae bacterium]|nr:Rieske (2Fe-2S) protein [Gemmatimonadaceae bacterium]
MTESKPSAPNDDCAGCTLHNRRDFLLDALRAGAAALAAIGMAPAGADAMPLRWISAIATGAERTYPIPATDGVQIDKDNEVILARTGNSVYAFALACPHQNTALRWDGGNNRFQCPKHKSKYRPDGTFIEGRATRSMDRYAVRLVGTSVAVDVDKVYQEDSDLTQWQHAVVTVP